MLGDRFTDALGFAADLHRSQRRKGTAIPYVSHLLAVAGLVLEHGAGEDVAIAALLHDSLEDQGSPGLEAAIALRFGREVLELVRACSDAIADAGAPKPPWRLRKAAYVAKLASAPAAACLIVACDKTHNLRCLLQDLDRDGPETLDRFSEPEGLAWYYSAVAEALAARATPGPVAELLSLAGELAQRVRKG